MAGIALPRPRTAGRDRGRADRQCLHAGDHAGGKCLRKIEPSLNKLRWLVWRTPPALLIVVAASWGDVTTEWADDLEGCAARNQPALTDPGVIPLAGGGPVVVKAFDIERDPADPPARAGR